MEGLPLELGHQPLRVAVLPAQGIHLVDHADAWKMGLVSVVPILGSPVLAEKGLPSGDPSANGPGITGIAAAPEVPDSATDEGIGCLAGWMPERTHQVGRPDLDEGLLGELTRVMCPASTTFVQ
jgi:hypothetical protein